MKKAILLVVFVCLLFSFRQKQLTWVAIGDSITYLNEHLDETGNRVKKGYLSRVVEQLPNIRYINQGHNGWTSGGIANSIEKLGLVKADIYSVLLGTNDWWHGRPVGVLDDYKNNSGNSTVYGSFRIIVNKLRSLNSTAKIILITPMQRTDFVYLFNQKNNAYGSYKEKNGQLLEQFARAIDSIGRYEHLPVIDLFHKSGMTLKNLVKYKHVKDPGTGAYKNLPYPKFIDIPFNAESDEYPYPVDAIGMTYDGLHPSDKGNSCIAGMLVKLMKKY